MGDDRRWLHLPHSSPVLVQYVIQDRAGHPSLAMFILCVNPWTRVNEKCANVTLVYGDEEPLTVITTDPATSALFLFAAFLYQAVYQVSKTTLFTLLCFEACTKAIALHHRKNMGVETLEANWGFGGNITLVWSVIASHVTTSSAYTFFPVS
jgi:hypothetical protein